MAALTPWLRQLVSRIPNVPEENITDELSYVIRDFCKESLAWRELLAGYNVLAGDADVDVNPVDGRRECVQVLRVHLSGEELLPYEQPWVPEANTPDTPKYYTCNQSHSVVTLLPTPSTSIDGGLAVYAALCPKCPDKWVPPFFIAQYFEAILDGTLGRFYVQPYKPYTNEKAASYHLARYRNKVREAWTQALRGNTVADVGWNYPRFGV